MRNESYTPDTNRTGNSICQWRPRNSAGSGARCTASMIMRNAASSNSWLPQLRRRLTFGMGNPGALRMPTTTSTSMPATKAVGGWRLNCLACRASARR